MNRMSVGRWLSQLFYLFNTIFRVIIHCTGIDRCGSMKLKVQEICQEFLLVRSRAKT